MTAYADLNEFVNRATGGNSGLPEFIYMHKEARVAGAAAAATVAGKWTSLWQYEGTPSHGAVPTTVAVPTNTLAGGMQQANPGGGRQKWMSACFGAAGNLGTLMLYDRLLHIGGLDATNIGAQTVGGALTRYTNGLGNQIWLEIYTQIGATGTTVTASYTNDAGASGHTTQAIPFGNTGAREAQRMIPLSLAAGDKGVQAVASVTVLATTGTVGNFGVNVIHPLATIACPFTGGGSVRTFVDGPLQEILSNACLGWAWLPNGTAAAAYDLWTYCTER